MGIAMKRIRCARFVLAFVAVCCSSALYAQNAGKIAGLIRDKAKAEFLPGVNIIIKGTRLGASTSADGSYFILNVPPGSYDVTASLVGYRTVTQQKVIVNIDKTTTLDFTLQESAVEADEVIITAERPDVVREKTSTSEVIRSDEVINTAGIRDLSDVLTLSADVSEGHFRGGREGEEAYNLSGMGIVNPLTGSVTFAPIMSAIEEVEVITSGFGAQYGNAQSGVVNISMKEGQSDRWRSRAEVRTRLPGYKHFGASIFDRNAQPYLQILDTPEKWLGSDDSNSVRYYGTVGNGFDQRYGRDSITLSQIAYSLYALQGRRDVNRKYNNLWDYSADVTIGGPISENARLFLASHMEDKWLFLPTPDPDRNRQVMGNLVFDFGTGMALRISGAYSQKWQNLLRSPNTTGFYSWIWDRVLGVSQQKENTVQIGARFTHALSAGTFYELRLNRLLTDEVNGSPVLDSNPENTFVDYSKQMWIRYNAVPDQFQVGNRDDDFGNEKTRTTSVDASLTSQVTNSHLLQAGLQANFYSIEVANRTNVDDPNGERDEFYSANPFEFGIFGQDKMEFEGMIANIGLRFDLWNLNTNYYTDLYSPFRVRNDSTVPTGLSREKAKTEKTPTLGRLQPRIGVSFPVSVSTVFHANYGSFVQRPAFSRTITSRIPYTGYALMTLGNPRLKPETTNSYDLGITQGLGEGFTVDLSAYYKDVKNLIEQALFSDSSNNYLTYINRDYADIRGFRVVLNKRRGILTGSLNYTFMVATGKASTPFDASPSFLEGSTENDDVPPSKARDITLDFDRTHNVILNLGLNTDEDWGPELLGGNPLERVTLSVTSSWRSGRPYTSSAKQKEGVSVNNNRSPFEYNTNLKVSKRVEKFFGVNATFSFEVVNLFNQKIYSYNAVFQRPVSTTGSSSINDNTLKYDTDPSSLQYYTFFSPFVVDQTFRLYSNSPRSYYFGIVLNM